jgi:hypothetical protein
MAERKNGLAALPAGLLRPTTQPEPEIAVDPGDTESRSSPTFDADEGRGEGAEPRTPAKPRRKRAPVTTGPAKGRKIHLPDDIHDRLWLLARQRRTTVSAVATEVLDRNLPRYKVEREG